MNRLIALVSLSMAVGFALGASNGPGLTKAQIRKLRTAGKVVVPSYIPDHFKVSEFDATPGDYTITYTGPNGATFAIEMASEGIGDVDLDTKDPNDTPTITHKLINNSTFGKHSMDVLTSKKERQFAVEWVDLGSKAKPRFLSITGQQMMSDEGAKIWHGLQYLKH
jgi:hypothetical protein